MKKPRFSLKSLMFAITIAAVLFAWWADHARLMDKNRSLQERLDARGRFMVGAGVDSAQGIVGSVVLDAKR